jgi:hypothetical protein
MLALSGAAGAVEACLLSPFDYVALRRHSAQDEEMDEL